MTVAADAYGISDIARYTWHCDTCHRPIRDGTGYLTVDWIAAMQAEQDTRKLDREHESDGLHFVAVRVSDLDRYPDDICWQAFHRRCDPNPDRNDYWFAVERARTIGQILDWNAHLHEKSWIDHTTWDRFIQRAAVTLKPTGPKQKPNRTP